MTCMLMGCGSKAIEEPLVMVEPIKPPVTYKLSKATKGDVILSTSITCNYVQTKEQEVVFPYGGKIVDKVYVKEGDIVNKGDILVELEVGNIEEQIIELEYEIAKTAKQLSYLDKAEEFDIEDSYYGYVYSSKMEEDDVKAWEKRDNKIKQRYTYKREDYADKLEFDQKKLDKLKSDLANSRIYATMSGTVLSVEKDLEGSTAKKDQPVMKLVDNADGRFESTEITAKDYFKEDQVVSMNIVYGTGKGDYELVPYNISGWGDKLTFSIFTAPDGVSIDVGTSGTIKVIIDQRQNVLTIPYGALNEADGKYYVYVLDEKDLRQVRYVEVGLIGDTDVEILSGLKEGEAVVRK